MAFVITFRGYRPSPRFDAVKWTTALIEQSAVTAGTGEPVSFVQIDSKPITDYPDPTDPPTLDFTTQLATELPGWYRIVFRDSFASTQATAPVLFTSESYRPSLRDVGTYILNRTADSNNNYLGTFTDDTTPTADEVEAIIFKSEQRILQKLDVDPNEPIPTESQRAVADAVALHSAMLVELTKFSEQIQTNRSPYQYLKTLWDELWPDLVKDVRGETPGTGTGGGSLSVWDLVASQFGEPSYAFPTLDLVNWDTHF